MYLNCTAGLPWWLRPAMWEIWVQSLSLEDPLKEGIATNARILAWRILIDRGAWRATVHDVTKSQTQLSDSAQHSTLYCYEIEYEVQKLG